MPSAARKISPLPAGTIDAGNLRAALAIVGHATRKSAMPALSWVELAGSGSMLELRASTLEVQCRVTLPCAGVLLPRVVQHRLLTAAVKGASGPVPIAGAASDGITLGGASIPRGGDYDARTPDLAESVGEGASVIYDTRALGAALGFVAPFIATDETRYNLCGVALDGECLVATDGHRLAVARGLPAPVSQIPGPGTRTVLIIPRAAIHALSAAIGKCRPDRVSATYGAKHVRYLVTGANLTVEVVARYIDGQYPDWTRVVPTRDQRGTLVLSTGALREQIKAAIPYAPDKACAVKLALGQIAGESGEPTPALSISARSEDAGAYLGHVPAEAIDGALPSTIGANGRYLLDAIDGADDLVSLGWDDDDGPILIARGNGQIAVVMPMRI